MNVRDLVVSVVFRDNQARSQLRRLDRQISQMTGGFRNFGRQIDNTGRDMSNFTRDANGRWRDMRGRFVSATTVMRSQMNGMNSSMQGFAHNTRTSSNTLNLFRQSASQNSSTLGGLTSSLLGAVSAYKLFDSTVGQAAKFEQSKVLIEAMFNDKQASTAYMKMMEKVAADSPVLNSGDMFSSSKALLTLTKDVGQLEYAWKIAEKLNVMSPEQGVEGAIFAMKELATGDTLSLTERFGLGKKDLAAIKTLSFDKQLDGLSKILQKMNMTDDVVTKMGSTTLSQWNKFGELMDSMFRRIGNTANSELGGALTRVNQILEGGGLDKIAVIGDKVLGKSISAIIDFGIKAKQYIQPVSQFFKENAQSIKAVAAAIGGLFAVSNVINIFKTLFNVLRSSPIGLLVTGITLLIQKTIGFQQAFSYIKQGITMAKNAFTSLNNIITTFVNTVVIPFIPKAQEYIMNAFTAIQPAIRVAVGIFSAVKGAIETLITKVAIPLFPVFKEIIGTAFRFISPIIRIASSLFQIVGGVIMFLVNNVIKPLIPAIAPIFKGMWNFVKPILDYMVAVFNAIADSLEWAIEKFKSFANAVKNFKMPKIGLPKWMGGNGLIQTNGSHATGLSRVPNDGYIGELHKDESVLTAKQSNALREAGILKNSNGKPIVEMPSQGSGAVERQAVRNTPIQIIVNGVSDAAETAKLVRKEVESLFARLNETT
ncbi:hypothetical protein EVU96_24870 [Bacillus infantis]|uniref:phage tail protein n=1 Tax=Bacillus infantis TaxID=324767 RepID=UPI00101B73DD|nr:hypothetical protein [Bacillus infantis]RYI25201.1 hypothetical protein EVU96_24870 [Bacillus infantis]